MSLLPLPFLLVSNMKLSQVSSTCKLSNARVSEVRFSNEKDWKTKGYSSHLFIVDKTEEMIGSYGPAPDAYEKKFQLEEAPSGILARGHYDAKVKYRLFNLSISFLLMRLCRANLLTMTVLSTLNGTGLLISRRIGRSDHKPPNSLSLSLFFTPLLLLSLNQTYTEQQRQPIFSSKLYHKKQMH